MLTIDETNLPIGININYADNNCLGTCCGNKFFPLNIVKKLFENQILIHGNN